ncbi:protein CBFA2T1 isoform X2 [Folsomia candida]|nr:protein CBFA2T1 isoform X2 [Folsomia candida]XP_035703817.1 protein CBFA2T1 isoform X2 [Folsomia candida]
MEGKQQQIIKEESHSPSSPRTTTPTPPTPQQIVPSGKENRIGSRDNGISGSRALTTSPALNTSTTTTVTAPNSGTASGHQQHGNLTNSEILTRSRSKGIPKEHIHSGRHRSSESPKGGGGQHHHHHHHRRDRSQSPLMAQTSMNLSIPRSSSTPNTTFPQNNHIHYSPHSTTPTLLSNGRRTPTPPSQQQHHQQIHSGSNNSFSAVRTPPSSSTVASGSSSSGSSSGGGNNPGNSRLLIKIKRFLGTLLHFGSDISPEVGDRVRTLVFSLVSGHLSIEEFHGGLQEVTSFPLRPFVLPFLRAHLPLLQREVGSLARGAKAVSTLAYITTHETSIIDPAAGEPCDIFHSEASDLSLSGNNNKRKVDSLYENGDCSSEHQGYTTTPKRHHGGSSNNSSFFSSPPTSFFPELREYYAAAAVSSAAYANLPLSLTNSSSSGSQNHSQHHSDPGPSTPLTNGLSTPKPAGEDEWKNIHTMLNCILSMVEKTKRALGILQSRASADLGNGGDASTWLRRPGPLLLDNSEELKRVVGEMMAQAFRNTEDRVIEVKRRAEEAVQEVKRQALAELKRAVASAEARACEAVASERARLERVLLESRGLGQPTTLSSLSSSTSSVPVIPPPPPAQTEAEACWNCGRKAHETCSGCNTARYCSSFCQHKDWESHHSVCKSSTVNSSSGGVNNSSGGSNSPLTGNTNHNHPSPPEQHNVGSRSPRSNHSSN